MGIELLFMLLPVAALSGWLLGRRRDKGRTGKDCPPHLNSRYFKGLNYLLDEQPDAALDVFIGISELDSESVEIQFALAALFLRRGEVDRAVRIHQNLIARPTLSAEHKRQALYALAMDYMSAGLLDRAENLFHELMDDPEHGLASRKQLLAIFQQEKEWAKAIEVAQGIRKQDGRQLLSPVVAQYYCELTEQAMRAGDLSLAGKQIQRAFDWDKDCVRASLLDAELAMRQGLYKQAIRACKRIEEQNPEYLPLILEPLERCHEQLDLMMDFREYLDDLVQRHPSWRVNETLVRLWLAAGERQRAELLLNQELLRQPGLSTLVGLLDVAKESPHDPVQWQRLRETASTLLNGKAAFQCRQCGYQGSQMLWNCPGCKQWNTIKPV